MKRINWRDVLKNFPVPREEPGIDGDVEGKLFPAKLVLFDVYGTLVKPLIGDLEAQLRSEMSIESFEETIRWFGLPKGIGGDLYKRFFSRISEIHGRLREIGIRQPEVLIEYVWRDILSDMGIQVSIEEARSIAIYREMKANPVAAFTGAARCLAKLKRKNIRIGLVSNSQFYTLPILSETLEIDLKQVFDPDCVFLSYELGFAKPDPHFFLMAKTRIAIEDISPREAVVVGNDWINDVRASKRFGFQTIFFRGEGREQEYDPDDIGDGSAIAYNYSQVEDLLNIRG